MSRSLFHLRQDEVMGCVEESDTPDQAVAAWPQLDTVGAGGEKAELAIDAVPCEVHKASEVTQRGSCRRHPEVQEGRNAASHREES